jgi:polysaccharide biosynthesis transport protein
MLRRRARLPVLAEISGPAPEARAWSLQRSDFEALEGVLPGLARQRVVLVSGEAEAAPVAAIALAAAAAASGRGTILVECDLARPRLAAHIGLAASPGLHEYLRWEAEPADVLQPVVLGGPAAGDAGQPLVCVCGGRPASKAETLLGLQSFAHMVLKLRNAYELVLLAGPPVLEEPGPCLAAARQADAVIAGLSASAVGGREAKATVRALRQLHRPAQGTLAVAVASASS